MFTIIEWVRQLVGVPGIAGTEPSRRTRQRRAPRRSAIGSRRQCALECLPHRVMLSATPTEISISASANSAIYGQTVNLSANVSALPSPPSEGNVAFFDNGALLGTQPVTSGIATLDNVALSLGSHAITAAYSDISGDFAASSTAVGPDSTINTVAGNGSYGYTGDGGPATAAEMNDQRGVGVDSLGNLYIADTGNSVVRKVERATGVITTVAGNGTYGYSGDGGAATSAQLNYPASVAVDAAGNLFIADANNNVIREVDHATGIITTVAGNGTMGYSGDGGPATAAELNGNFGIAVDASGNLFIADRYNNAIREVDHTTGIITTIAGNGTYGFSGDGGAATAAQLSSPYGVAVDASGNVFIADTSSQRIREVDHTTGIITTIAGNGTAGDGGDGGAATSAQLNYPLGVAVDSAGNVFIGSDFIVRMVDHTTGTITTIAGNGTNGFSGDGGPANAAVLFDVSGVAVDASGNLFLSDTDNNRVREVTSGAALVQVTAAPTSITISASANSAVYGQTVNLTANVSASPTAPSEGNVAFFDNGTLLATQSVTSGVATLDNVVLSAGTHAITVTYGDANGNFAGSSTAVGPSSTITTVAGNGTAGFGGDGGAATAAKLLIPYGVAVDSSGNLFVADSGSNRIREVNHATGIITTVAGTGMQGFSGDGGAATAAELCYPYGIAVDSSGNLFIADTNNNVIREVNHATGVITTVAGNGTSGLSGDGGAATAASLNDPYGVAVDASGDLFIADTYNSVIRKVDHTTGIITTVAGNGTGGFGGDGGAATAANIFTPHGVAVDSSGNLFVADFGNDRIREVNHTTGVITTVAGNGTRGYSGDGGLATSAELHDPAGITFNSSGDLLIADFLNNRIRQVDHATGIITTLAGNGTQGSGGDGGPAANAQFYRPVAVAFDPAGNLFISDSLNNLIREVSAAATVSVSPATLTVTADDAVKTLGATNPPLTYTVTGFVNGDNATALSGSADMSTTATADSGMGTYPITAALGTLAASNYSFVLQNGTLTVTVNAQGPFELAEDHYVIGSGTLSVSAGDGLLANDRGPGQLTVTAGTVTGAEGGTFTFNADGSFTYTPPAAGLTGFDHASYTATDTLGNQGTATVNVLSPSGSDVWKLYESLLHRAPDYGGLQAWTNNLTHGATLSEIVTAFLDSTERLTQVVNGFYEQYLGRPADAAGLNNSLNLWRASGDPALIKVFFAISPEFNALAQAQYGAYPNGWLEALYHRVLNRAPDAAGFNFWSEQLANGMSEYQVALAFVRSAEADGAEVTGWFQQYLGRAPSAADVTSFVALLQAGASDRAIEQAIIGSPEFSKNYLSSP